MTDLNPRWPPPARWDWGIFYSIVSAVLLGEGVTGLIEQAWATGLTELLLTLVTAGAALTCIRRQNRRQIAESIRAFDESVRRRDEQFQRMADGEGRQR